MSLSAHKVGGPQGVGALIAGPRARLSRQIHGGGQERGLRAGTENVPGIAGFGAAADAAVRDLPHAMDQAAWRDAAAMRLQDEAEVTVAGEGVVRLPGTLSFVCEGFSSELQVMALDLAGVMVSAGSACSSGKVTPSAVWTAMGLADLAACSLRVSGGWATSRPIGSVLRTRGWPPMRAGRRTSVSWRRPDGSRPPDRRARRRA